MLSIGAFARLGHVSPRMLRHYDRVGIMKPEHVDPDNGYRGYSVTQLVCLHRVVALLDLGFTLEQIRPLLEDDVPVEELRGMLRLRRAQIEHTLSDEAGRLRRVDAHLRAIERSDSMSTHEVVVKETTPLRIAEAVGTAPGFGHELIGPVFEQLGPIVLDRLRESGARPGYCVGYYDEPQDDGTVTVHVAFEVGDQAVMDDERVRVVSLPRVEVASLVHSGAMGDIESSYETLFRWIEDSGYRPVAASRELYLEWHGDDDDANVTELQLPIGR